MTLSRNSDLAICDEHIITMISVSASVEQFIGSARYGTRLVRHGPGSGEVPGATYRRGSAHSVPVMRERGRHTRKKLLLHGPVTPPPSRSANGSTPRAHRWSHPPESPRSRVPASLRRAAPPWAEGTSAFHAMPRPQPEHPSPLPPARVQAPAPPCTPAP